MLHSLGGVRIVYFNMARCEVLYAICLPFLVQTVLFSSLVGLADSAQCQQVNGSIDFKLGLLIPWNGIFKDFSGLTSASAVSIAIEAINEDPILNKRMNFR